MVLVAYILLVKGEKNVNHKIHNSNGYELGSHNTWQDRITTTPVLAMVVASLLVIMITATYLIWA